MKPKHLLRAIKIKYIFIRYGLDDVLLSTPWFAPLRLLRFVNPYYWFANKKLTQAQRIRMALESLGPIFVKFGQILSTRYDMLPKDVLHELAKLRDQVPAFSSQKAIQIIESSYQAPIKEMFATFAEQPLASASIAQVHEATLHDGKHVVVKVLRPNIKKQIEKDLGLLTCGAQLLERCSKRSRRFKPVAMMQEIKQCFLSEIDLMQEAANATQLQHNLSKDSGVYIPEIYWDYCRPNVLVMEKVHGIPVANMEALQAADVDLKKLAADGLEVFFTQIFRDRYFHGDLHPGNIFINPENNNYILVDFGIMGSLTESDQRYIAENLLAFLQRDYLKVAKLHVECGWVPKDTRVDLFESAIRGVCEPIFNRPIKEISLGKMLVRLIQTARQFEMNIQPQLILLQKTLLQIEGLCRQLDPELNLWTTAKPIIEKWLKQQVGPKAFFRKLKEYAPYWLERAPELPDLVHEVLLTRTQPVTEMPPERSNRPAVIILIMLLVVFLITLNTDWLPLWVTNIFVTLGIAGFVAILLKD